MRTLNSIICLSLCGLLSACGEDPGSSDAGGGGGADTGGNGPAVGGGELGGGAVGGADLGGSAPIGPTVKVTVRDYEGHAVAGLEVIANNANGALIGGAITDGEGAAELAVPPEGSVSVLHENDYGSGHLARNVETIVFRDTPPQAVALNIDVDKGPGPADPSMTLDIWYAPHPSATTYQLFTSCGSSDEVEGGGITATLSGCTESGVLDAVLVARDAAGAIVDHARVDDLPFVPNAFQSQLMTWTGDVPTQVAFVLTNIPSGGAVAGSSMAGEREPGGSARIISSRPFQSAMGVATFALQHVASYGNEHCQEGNIRISTGEVTKSYMRRRCTPAADLSSLSVDAKHLTQFDPAAPELAPHTLRWTAGEDAAVGDVLLVEQLWYRGENVTGTWSAYLAPAVRDVVFPELPESLAAFALQPSDVFSNTRAVHRDYADIDGFNAAVEQGVPVRERVSVEEYFSLFGD